MSEMNLNLLPSRAKFQAQKVLWISRINKFMVLLVGSWLFLAVTIVGINFYVGMVNKNSQKKLATTINEFSSYDTTIQNNQKLKYKAKLVGEVLASRFEYSTAFKSAQEFFPEGVNLIKFSIEDDKVLKIEATTQGKDIEKVEKQIQLVNAGQSKIYKSAKISSLSWDSGFWKFLAEVNL